MLVKMLSRAWLLALPLASGAMGAVISNVSTPTNDTVVQSQITAEDDKRETCTTDKCWRLALSLHGAMTRKPDKVDPCEDWDKFICGNYDKLRLKETKMRPDQQEVTIRTLMEDQIDHLLKEVMENPHGNYSEYPPLVEAHQPIFDRMRRYYSKCTDKKQLGKTKLGPLKKIIDDIHGIFGEFEQRYDSKESTYQDGMVNTYDTDAITKVTQHLSNYQIWVLAKAMPQQSMFNSSTMKIGVQPYLPQGLPRKELYGSKKHASEYKKIVRDFLKQTWEVQWKKKRWDKIAEQVVELEANILKLLPAPDQWRHIRDHTVQWTSKQLETAAPDLAILSTTASQRLLNNRQLPLNDLEVMFSYYWPQLQSLINKTPRAVFRAFTIWQAFVQTHYLFEDKLSNRYRDLLRNIDGTEKEPPLDARCRTRASKHFGPLLSAIFMNDTYNESTDRLGHEIFKDLQEELVKVLNETSWMQNNTKITAIEKANKTSAMIGYSHTHSDTQDQIDLTSYFAGVVGAQNPSNTRTHADDYLQMQSWYYRKAWFKDLYDKPSKYDAGLNSYDVNMQRWGLRPKLGTQVFLVCN